MKRILAAVLIAVFALTCASASIRSGEYMTISAGMGHVDAHISAIEAPPVIRNTDLEFNDIFAELSYTAENVEVFCIGGFMTPKTISGVDIDTFNEANAWTEITENGPEKKFPSVYGIELKAGAGLRLQLGDADIALDGYGGLMMIENDVKLGDLYIDTTFRFSLIGARAKLSLHLLPFLHIWGTAAAEYNMTSQTDIKSYYADGLQYPEKHYELNDDSGYSYKYGFGVSVSI